MQNNGYIRIMKRALELKFKGERLMVQPRTRWFSLALDNIKDITNTNWLETEKEKLWEEGRDWKLFTINLCKMEMVLKEDSEGKKEEKREKEDKKGGNDDEKKVKNKDEEGGRG
jgi:hypothetical protein